MSDAKHIVEHYLLEPNELRSEQLVDVLGSVMTPALDAADLYLQYNQEESWFLEDGIVKQGQYDIDAGFGFRAVCGDKTGYAHADNINIAAMLEAGNSARSIIKSGKNASVALGSHSVDAKLMYPSTNPIQSLPDTDKVLLLQELDVYARAKDPRVKQVRINLSASYDVVMILNHQGQLCRDIRPEVNVSVTVIVEAQGKREIGSSGAGARADYGWFAAEGAAKAAVDRAVHKGLLNLEAEAAPAGVMPVVLGPGWPAVLLHEAVGHGLEGDYNRRDSSVFSRLMGERVATPHCTIVDDATLPGRRGSLTVDDEGTPGQYTVLIEDGILKNYMQDQLNARLMGAASTGNCRRQSYAFAPLPRMTNTYMLPGEHDPKAIVASLDCGVYALDFSGGQVDTTSGDFVFTTSEAYYVENGKIQYPIKGATLIGNGPRTLQQISMVGNDLELDPGVGQCGKSGQGVPVGVGQPTLRVDALTVGGQKLS